MDRRIPIPNKWGGAHDAYISWSDRAMRPIDQDIAIVQVNCFCAKCLFGWQFSVVFRGDELRSDHSSERVEAVLPVSLRNGMTRLEQAFGGTVCDKKIVNRYMKHNNPKMHRNRYIHAIEKLRKEGRSDEIQFRD